MRSQQARPWVQYFLVTTAVAALLCTARPANAENWGGFWGPNLEGFAVAVGILGAGFVVGGIATGIRNGVSAGRGERRSHGMIAAGVILNLINVTASALWMSQWKSDDKLRYGVGIPLAAVGSAGLGLSIWAATRSEKPQQVSLSLVPQLALDRAGGLAYGAGLRVTGF